MVTLWVTLLVAASTELAPGLSIETGSPDALCPEVSATRAAVEARLGVVGVEGRAGWVARYTMWHAPGKENADFVRLQVLDPTGAERLQRDLPLAGESCSTMASIIALVLERYFRELGRTEQPASQPAAAAEAPRAPPPAPPPRLPRASAPRRLVLSGMAGLLASPLQPALAAGAAFETRRLRLALQVAWSASHPEESLNESGDGGGAATLRTSVPARLAVQLWMRRGRLQLHGGPELAVVYERAAGDVAAPRVNSRLVVGAGVQTGAALSIGRRWRVTLDAALDRVVGGGRFMVDEGEALRMTWRGMATIGLAYVMGNEGF